jgi:hypothetical protein
MQYAVSVSILVHSPLIYVTTVFLNVCLYSVELDDGMESMWTEAVVAQRFPGRTE